MQLAEGKENFVKGENTVIVNYLDKETSFNVSVTKKSGCGAIGIAAAGGGITTVLMVVALFAAVSMMLIKRKRA